MHNPLIAALLLLFVASAAATPDEYALHQINATHWYFESTQYDLAEGDYTYQAFANTNSSDYRVLTYGGDIPPTPTNLQHTTGNFWVNHTWNAGAGNIIDSYNVSVNGVWHNGTTNTHYNDTYTAHAWQNITVYAFSGSGSLSTSSTSQNTQIPNNPIVITNTGDWSGEVGENVSVDYNATDADSDTPTFSCNRTDLFTNFNTTTGTGNWTTNASGTFKIDFGVSDGHGSTSNYTMTVTAGTTPQQRSQTTIPISLFTVMLVLLMCIAAYSLHVSTHAQKIFGGMVSMIMAFMLSQQIVSGNVVQITTLLSSTDTIITEKTEIIIPELAYLLLFIATIMTLITAIFFTKYIIYLYEESQKKRTGGIK